MMLCSSHKHNRSSHEAITRVSRETLSWCLISSKHRIISKNVAYSSHLNRDCRAIALVLAEASMIYSLWLKGGWYYLIYLRMTEHRAWHQTVRNVMANSLVNPWFCEWFIANTVIYICFTRAFPVVLLHLGWCLYALLAKAWRRSNWEGYLESLLASRWFQLDRSVTMLASKPNMKPVQWVCSFNRCC
jgi:hypothetical protein